MKAARSQAGRADLVALVIALLLGTSALLPSVLLRSEPGWRKCREEALAGGPVGKVRDGDVIEIIVDRKSLEGSINLVGRDGKVHGKEWGDAELARRPVPDDLRPHPDLPDDTRLWAALQAASGGTWGGCVFDVETVVERLGGAGDQSAR